MTEGVPLLDPTRENAAIEEELRAAFARVLQSGCFILGPEVEAFEEACARYVGSKHAIAVSSGTDALLSCLMALGVGPGDEVVCPTYTFFATAGSIWRTGARPVFTDVRPCCWSTDPEDLARRLTGRTKAILPVHLFGQCADMDPILELSRARGIPVIEDAAQALGAGQAGRRAGTMGTFGCFSFFPSKNLGGFGDAGLVTTDDDAHAQRVRILRAHGGDPKYHHALVGGNFRMDALQAALLRVKLDHLEGYTARRRENAELYHQLLSAAGVATRAPSACAGAADAGSGVAPILLPASCRERHIYNQYVIRARGDGARDRLRSALARSGIGTEIYYPVPLHLQRCFEPLGHCEGSFPIAEAASRETLALPIFPELTREEIELVVRRITEVYK